MSKSQFVLFFMELYYIPISYCSPDEFLELSWQWCFIVKILDWRSEWSMGLSRHRWAAEQGSYPSIVTICMSSDGLAVMVVG